jgi:hypothetical protein
MSEFVPRLRLVDDVSPADWLRARVDEAGVGGSGVPTGFESYVQVLHPARGRNNESLRWRTIADWLGQPLLPGVWFQDLEEFAATKSENDRPWAYAPNEGQIPDEVLDLLKPVLDRHTGSEHGWFCLWEGWGFLSGSTTRVVAWHVDHQPPPGTPYRFHSRPALPPEVRKGPKVRLPYRDYFLFEGPLDAVCELGAWITWEPGGGREYERQTPSLWWPGDQAWCAGNDIDASCTCIGGSRALGDELLHHPALEVLEVDPKLKYSPYGTLNDPDR